MDEKERMDSTGNSRGMSDTDKEYYEDLYNDLPKEVVDILMQTHPLMGKHEGDSEATAYRTRRPQREDLEEVREARMQQVGSEINEIRKAPQQEGEPTRYVSRRQRSMEQGYEETPASYGGDDDYQDEIQYVSVMPARKKSRVTEEAMSQTAAPAKKKRKKREQEPMPFSEMERSGDRPRYEDIDFEERAKQEHLDSLYDDYDDDYRRGKSKLPVILGVVGLILIIVLIFRVVSLGGKLEEAQQQVTESQTLNEKYEQVQLEKMQLQEELDALKNPDGTASTDGESTDEESGDSNSSSTSTSGTTTSGSTKEHIVQDNETPWTIAAKYYGNGAEYQKILDANGLKEGDNIRPGDVLKIPDA